MSVIYIISFAQNADSPEYSHTICGASSSLEQAQEYCEMYHGEYVPPETQATGLHWRDYGDHSWIAKGYCFRQYGEFTIDERFIDSDKFIEDWQ